MRQLPYLHSPSSPSECRLVRHLAHYRRVMNWLRNGLERAGASYNLASPVLEGLAAKAGFAPQDLAAIDVLAGGRCVSLAVVPARVALRSTARMEVFCDLISGSGRSVVLLPESSIDPIKGTDPLVKRFHDALAVVVHLLQNPDATFGSCVNATSGIDPMSCMIGLVDAGVVALKGGFAAGRDAPASLMLVGGEAAVAEEASMIMAPA